MSLSQQVHGADSLIQVMLGKGGSSPKQSRDVSVLSDGAGLASVREKST